jgi:hypothetical protein
MVVDKVVELQTFRPVATHLIEALYRVGDLKKVMIVVTRVQRLVEMIIGDRMQCSLVDPAGIVAMDHLAHQPEIGFDFICHVAQCLHIFKVQHIGGVQTDSVDIKFADPETDHITDVIPDRGIVLVQLYKKIVAAPVFIGKAVVVFIISAEVDIAVPVAVRGIFPVAADVLKGKKVSAGVVKDAVKNDADSLFVACQDKICQILVVTEAAV